AENLRATEDAKAEVERNLESVTAEREELAENLRATEDAKAEVERNLESVTAERNEAVLGISNLEKSRRKLRDAYVNLQRMSAENDVRVRVRHDRLSFTDGSAGSSGNEFSVTKKLLGARGLFGKENNAQ
ncbi:myosin heavy chain, partial [Trypanosoma cruzi]